MLGSGGREDALAWGLSRSSVIDEVLATPGNPGISRYADTVTARIDSPREMAETARSLGVGLVVIGPEVPLVAGVADALNDVGVATFGPVAAAARIEGSKRYAKKLMDLAGIATARWEAFTEVANAVSFMDELGPPYVIKADGLAAGKGVVVTSDRKEAIDALADRLERGAFGDAGSSVVIEEYLDGEEASVIAFADGRNVLACEPAQDYKRVDDDDQGLNTGGMGSYSPVPACPPSLVERISAEVLEPMIAATSGAGAPFTGALYAGLALTSSGPKVIEFNARFGDPETQALIPRLASDLGEVCLACARGSLDGMKLEWRSEACVSVVLASGGYPGPHDTGFEIEGVERAQAIEGVNVFHAGTALVDGRLVTSGGRVLAVSALGPTFGSARALAYEAAGVISFDNMHIRSDIAERAEKAEVDR